MALKMGTTMPGSCIFYFLPILVSLHFFFAAFSSFLASTHIPSLITTHIYGTLADDVMCTNDCVFVAQAGELVTMKIAQVWETVAVFC